MYIFNILCKCNETFPVLLVAFDQNKLKHIKNLANSMENFLLN